RLAREAHQMDRRGVGNDKTARAVLGENDVRQGVDQGPQQVAFGRKNLLRALALGDVQKSDHAADALVAPEHWIRPIFDGKAAAVLPPEHLLIPMSAWFLTHAQVNATSTLRIRRTIRSGMVNQVVHVL